MSTAECKRYRNRNSFQNLECVGESVIQELKEKMSRLKFRLLDCQNQNHMLRKELLLAKKVVDKEISPTPKEKFVDLLNQSSGVEFQGRRDKIVLLKKKLGELQNKIKELEESNVGDNAPEDSVTPPKENKLKAHNKCQSKQMMDKELQYLLENSCQLKRKLEVWKKRNVELSKEEELLRLELDRLLEKSKEDQFVHESYRGVEKELRARQKEKLDIRRKLDVEKTRNEQLDGELSSLREDISLILNKTNDDKVLIEALTDQQGYLHDLLERQKMISEGDNRKFIDDLREIQTKHATNYNVLNHLQDIVSEKNLACMELQEYMKQKELVYSFGYAEEQETVTSISVDSQQSEHSEPPQQAAPANEAPSESNERSEADAEEEKLREECEQHKNIFLSVQEEINQLINATSSNTAKLNEWMVQLLQTQSSLAEKNAEIRNLEATVKRLQKALPSNKKECTSPQMGSNFIEDTLKTIDVLNEEHQFLLYLWELLVSEKENSMEIYIMSTGGARHVFVESLNELLSPDNVTKSEKLSQAENEEKT